MPLVNGRKEIKTMYLVYHPKKARTKLGWEKWMLDVAECVVCMSNAGLVGLYPPFMGVTYCCEMRAGLGLCGIRWLGLLIQVGGGADIGVGLGN